jgi:hypothetical protein
MAPVNARLVDKPDVIQERASRKALPEQNLVTVYFLLRTSGKSGRYHLCGNRVIHEAAPCS